MADQIERLTEAVNKVARNITRLSTYSNVIYLGKVSTAISSAVSGALGSLLKAVQLVGTTAATSAVSGAMKVVYFLGGSNLITASSSATGSMSNSKSLAGSATGISMATLRYLNSVQLAGSAGGVSSVSGPAVFMQRCLAGSVTGKADLPNVYELGNGYPA